YYGSFRHFMKCLLNDKIKDSGYEAIFVDKDPEKEPFYNYTNNEVNRESLLFMGEINFNDYVKITYYNELSSGHAQTSFLELTAPTAVYVNGEPVNPYAIIMLGHMAEELFPYILPMEYEEQVGDQKAIKFYQNIIRPFKHYQSIYPVETIHIHTDKSLYFPMETIWMKAYINIMDQPSELSSKLFVQLSDQDSTYLKNIMVTKEGVGIGQLVLPDSIPEGDYVLTAYTNWRDTLPDQFHFRKNIRIGIGDLLTENSPDIDKSFELRLFPEGGNFTEGIINSFAYEIKDENGNPVNESIEILTGDKVVLSDSADWQGKGHATLKILPRKEYFARVSSQPEKAIPLKIIDNHGISIVTNQLDSTITVIISKTEKKKELYHYLLIANNQILDYKSFDLGGEYRFHIRKENMHEGVNQLTIFDDKFRPEAERLLFKEPNSNSPLPGFSFATQAYEKRSPVELNFVSKDRIRDASLAVLDMSQTAESGDENILVSHYLRPWIQGSITGTEELFKKGNQEKFDLLMMTNGWRRYNWKDHYEHRQDTIRDVIIKNGIDINGRVLAKNTDTPIKNSVVILTSGTTGFLSTFTDSEGRFSFDNVFYTDSTDLIFKVQSNQRKQDFKFEFDEAVWKKPGERDVAVEIKQTYDTDLLQENNEMKVKLAEIYKFDGKTYYLKDAVIEGEKISLTKLDESPFSSQFSDVLIIDSLDLGSTPTTFDVLSRRFPKVVARTEMNIETNTLETRIRVNGWTPAIFIDNLPAQAADLQSLGVGSIYSIELLRGPDAAILGYRGAGGALIVITKKNSGKRRDKSRSDFLVNRLKGFQQYREFYSPDYSQESKDYIPDRRSTLYWNPDITSEVENITYYNHDNPAPVKVIMEGYTNEGKPFRQTTFYEIDK
ncbi:MAG: hypothetical protein WBA74_25100, partial [Cyclobacteriaceae bacterium]